MEPVSFKLLYSNEHRFSLRPEVWSLRRAKEPLSKSVEMEWSQHQGVEQNGKSNSKEGLALGSLGSLANLLRDHEDLELKEKHLKAKEEKERQKQLEKEKEREKERERLREMQKELGLEEKRTESDVEKERKGSKERDRRRDRGDRGDRNDRNDRDRSDRDGRRDRNDRDRDRRDRNQRGGRCREMSRICHFPNHRGTMRHSPTVSLLCYIFSAI